ncbi:hypothetical protein ABZT04_34635 [Streptomyces sp. NPDC005492]|uniref:hypothetical protein n=1 Tax=Streptomyces sp. NPDC005492 TaxID=3156883 RepID=UPI0033BBCFE1
MQLRVRGEAAPGPSHDHHGAGTTGVGGATLAATGLWLNGMAMMVAATTLVAAGMALYKPAPRPRRR